MLEIDVKYEALLAKKDFECIFKHWLNCFFKLFNFYTVEDIYCWINFNFYLS